jgi:hypothetical protein
MNDTITLTLEPHEFRILRRLLYDHADTIEPRNQSESLLDLIRKFMQTAKEDTP